MKRSFEDLVMLECDLIDEIVAGDVFSHVTAGSQLVALRASIDVF